MRIVERRKIWFALSAILILPGLIFMIWHAATTGSPLPLSIDYTGGTQWEIRFPNAVAPTAVRDIFSEAGYADTTSFLVNDDRTVQLKLKTLTPAEKDELAAALTAEFGQFDELSFRSIGPSIGAEVSQSAVWAVVAASVLTLIYIAAAFREVAHPFRYGVAAIAALIHDILATISFLGIMHLVAGWEVDALFLTAALTIIGFSVNDTIVIFDRVRENLRRHKDESFATVMNRSILETATRSLATQVSVWLVLFAIFMFGGATLRVFMAVLLVGMLSGAYSSIFTSAPIVVAWEERSLFGRSDNSRASSRGRAALA